MGARGSLHISTTTCNKQQVIDILRKEYANPKSHINEDITHDGFNTSFLFYNNELISIYDASYCVYGDIRSSAEYVSSIVNAPVMGITNGHADIIDFCVANNGTIVISGECADGWYSEVDISGFISTMKLPYPTDKQKEMFQCANMYQFMDNFRQLTNRPIFTHVLDGCPIFPEYLNLVYSDELLKIFEQKRPFQWDKYGDIQD